MTSTEAVLEQPWLHDLIIAVDGNSTALSAPDGDLNGVGAQGWFVDDQRVLSRFCATLSGSPITPIRSTPQGNTAGFLGSARRLGNPGADPTVELQRTRELHGGELTETLALVSRASTDVQTELTVRLGVDGAELHDVKTGHPERPLLDATVDGGIVSWNTTRQKVTARFTPEPARTEVRDGEVIAAFPLTVAPGTRGVVRVQVRTERLTPSRFDADAGSDAVDWSALAVHADDPRLGSLVQRSVTDLQHLLMRDPQASDDIFAAAGTPWYLTLFGRDSIWTARMSLPLGTTLAAGTLRALARRQGTKLDPMTAEAPGRIPHELRRVTFEDPGHGMTLPPVYYGTVDATALWVCLLEDAWRWGLAEREVRDLVPAMVSAVTWLLEHASPGDDGLIKYIDESGHGLANQGWKDSGDSMRLRDGSLAEAPIALVEAQAYAAAACRGAAQLLRAFPDLDAAHPGLADRLTSRADDLTAVIRERFWVAADDGGVDWLAMAIDGLDRQVNGIGSNMGHVLGTGCLTDGEVEAVEARLMSPEMLSAYGIRTMSTDTGGFNPIGYHTGSVWVHDTAICALGLAREGRSDAASVVAQRLVAAGEQFGFALPELFSEEGPLGRPAPYPASCRPQAWACAAPLALVSAVLGLAVDVPGRRVTVRPSPVTPFGALRVDGVRVGDALMSVAVSADGTVTVDGLPDGFTLDTPSLPAPRGPLHTLQSK